MGVKRKRYRADDWLDLALAELAQAGPDAVKLEALCAAAGLTRGSFYHHFGDHEAFLVAMAERWLVQQTDQLAEQLLPMIGEGQISPEVMQKMTEVAVSIDYKLELAMRDLGRRVADVNEVVRTADAKRIGVMTKIYEHHYGQPPELASRYAYLEYAAFSGIVLLNPDMPEDEQMGLAALYEQTMLAALKKEV